MPLSLLLVLVVAVGTYVLWTYNRFVRLRQRADNAFSDVDVQLKRRWDLVPALVETVRGYAGHEHEVLAQVVAARGRVMAAGAELQAPGPRGEREADLARTLRRIFVLAEAYPALKADRNFLELHRTLVAVEDDIQNARRYHNAVIRDLNTLRQSQPAAFVGRLAGVETRGFFQVDGEERAAPAVALGPDDSADQEVVS